MTRKSGKHHLIVESGPDKGRTLVIAPSGSRMGRSSKNDITLTDPLLSRHHCRFFFKENDGLWVADLGSANETLLNGKAVMEGRVRPGDKVSIGDTVLDVVGDLPMDVTDKEDQTGPVVDLGLNPVAQKPTRSSFKLSREWIIGIAVVAVAIVGVAIIHYRPFASKGEVKPIAKPKPSLPSTIEIAYEKVEGTADNIFRYMLTIDRDRVMTVQVDDLKNERRLREEKAVDVAKIKRLIESFHEDAFFTLKPEYAGFRPNTLTQWDIAITLGRETQRTLVRNRPEPEEFKRARERIEAFGKTEMGLWAIQFPREKLVEMSREAFERARRLYAQRDVKHSNLHEAIVNLERAHMDLRSVEPKPDYYADSVTLLSDCRAMLDDRYKEISFRADQAMNLRQWERASRDLRIILEMIPDESDARNRQTRDLLIEADNRQRQGG